MSVITCMGSVSLDLNLSKPDRFYFGSKFQDKIKTKAHKFFTISCCHFFHSNFCQVRYIIKNKFEQNMFSE